MVTLDRIRLTGLLRKAPLAGFPFLRLQSNERRTEMGRIVVTEFVSLDGVMEAPGGGEDFKHGGWSFEIERGEEGDQFKLDETARGRRAAAGARDLRGLRGGLAVPRGRVRRQVQQHAQVRRLLDPRGPGVEQLDRARGRRGGGGREAEAGAGRRHRRPRQRPARADADRARPRRRVAADGVPGRARDRKAPLRRDIRWSRGRSGWTTSRA